MNFYFLIFILFLNFNRFVFEIRCRLSFSRRKISVKSLFLWWRQMILNLCVKVCATKLAWLMLYCIQIPYGNIDWLLKTSKLFMYLVSWFNFVDISITYLLGVKIFSCSWHSSWGIKDFSVFILAQIQLSFLFSCFNFVSFLSQFWYRCWLCHQIWFPRWVLRLKLAYNMSTNSLHWGCPLVDVLS